MESITYDFQKNMVNSKEPVEVNLRYLQVIMMNHEKKGRFFSKSDGQYIAVDNSTCGAYTEVFTEKEICIKWLRGEIEL